MVKRGTWDIPGGSVECPLENMILHSGSQASGFKATEYHQWLQGTRGTAFYHFQGPPIPPTTIAFITSPSGTKNVLCQTRMGLFGSERVWPQGDLEVLPSNQGSIIPQPPSHPLLGHNCPMAHHSFAIHRTWKLSWVLISFPWTSLSRLCNWQSPDLSGCSGTSEIKSLRGKAQNIPFKVPLFLLFFWLHFIWHWKK